MGPKSQVGSGRRSRWFNSGQTLTKDELS